MKLRQRFTLKPVLLLVLALLLGTGAYASLRVATERGRTQEQRDRALAAAEEALLAAMRLLVLRVILLAGTAAVRGQVMIENIPSMSDELKEFYVKFKAAADHFSDQYAVEFWAARRTSGARGRHSVEAP